MTPYLDDGDTLLADLTFEAEQRRDPKRTRIYLSPSKVYDCRRRLQARITGVPETNPESEASPAAKMGTYIHDGITATRRSLYPGRSFGLRIELPWTEGGTGEVDEYDPESAEVVDYKTLSRSGFDRRRALGEPKMEHRAQTDLYGHCLLAMDCPVERCAILYVCRDTGRSWQVSWEYDPAVTQEHLDWMVGTAWSIEQGIEQPRDRRGPGLDIVCDQWCAHKDWCWGEQQAGFTVQSQRWQGDDEKIEQWASLYAEARAKATEWTERKEEAAENLRGHKGTFGEWKVGQGRDGKPKEVPDVEQCVALLEEHQIPVPMAWANGKRGALSVVKA